MPDEKPRAYETRLEIDAPTDTVWDALTDADELTRWFPLDARVEPGEGGSVWWSWGGGWEGEQRIEIWEPGRHLRTVDERAQPFDPDGRPVEEVGEPVEIAVDYHLESAPGTGEGSGRTVLRLVHSGFGRGAKWDDEFDSVSRGWGFELQSLKHYLEHHRGERRRVVWLRAACDLSFEEIWARLAGREGMVRSGRLDGLGVGDPYEIETAAGDRFAGTVVQALLPGNFAGTAEAWGGALLRISVERCGGRTDPHVWLSSWGETGAPIEEFERRTREIFDRLFPTSTTD